MLRVVVALLLTGNALLLAWQLGLFNAWLGAPGQGDREPERLQRQVHAERVRILPPADASSALQAAERARKAAAASDAQSRAAVDTRCMAAGPFNAADLAAAEQALGEADLAAGSWSAVPTLRPGSFMIYMGRFADGEAFERKRAELERLKIDAEPLNHWDALQPGLVLGRFDDKDGADRALAALGLRGVRTARIVTVSPAAALSVLRVPQANAEQRAKLTAIKLPTGQKGFGDCAESPGKP